MIIKILFITILSLTSIVQTHEPSKIISSEVTLSQTQKWIYGMLGGLSVSLIGFFSAFMLVGLSKCVHAFVFEFIIKILLAFSCGSLLSQVTLHILPKAYEHKNINNTFISLLFMSSILSFVIFERIFESYDSHHSDKKSVNTKKQKQEPPHKSATGYLNLIGSLIHNFVDGMSIGVAFATGSKQIYFPILTAIIAHEIPRQMSDVAILMNSKFSHKQTIISNGVINFISLFGAYLGLQMMVFSIEVQMYILVFIAGNFLFIAAGIWKDMFKGKHISIKGAELIAVLLSVVVVTPELFGLAGGQSHSHVNEI